MPADGILSQNRLACLPYIKVVIFNKYILISDLSSRSEKYHRGFWQHPVQFELLFRRIKQYIHANMKRQVVVICPVLQKTLQVKITVAKCSPSLWSVFRERFQILQIDPHSLFRVWFLFYFFFLSDDEDVSHTLGSLLVPVVSLLISGSSMVTSLLHGSRRAEVNTPMQCSESPHTVAHACSANRAVSSQTLYCLHK